MALADWDFKQLARKGKAIKLEPVERGMLAPVGISEQRVFRGILGSGVIEEHDLPRAKELFARAGVKLIK